jgi:hypothetical protein
MTIGYLYVILCKDGRDDPLYKIGITANDVESRLAQLQTGSPYELEVSDCYGFENIEVVERAIHHAFRGQRERGEWFRLGFSERRKFLMLCSLLDGTRWMADKSRLEEAKEAEASIDTVDGAKYDYAAMFAEGWRIERSNSKGKRDYWVWRREIYTVNSEPVVMDKAEPDMEGRQE